MQPELLGMATAGTAAQVEAAAEAMEAVRTEARQEAEAERSRQHPALPVRLQGTRRLKTPKLPQQTAVPGKGLLRISKPLTRTHHSKMRPSRNRRIKIPCRNTEVRRVPLRSSKQPSVTFSEAKSCRAALSAKRVRKRVTPPSRWGLAELPATLRRLRVLREADSE